MLTIASCRKHGGAFHKVKRGVTIVSSYKMGGIKTGNIEHIHKYLTS